MPKLYPFDFVGSSHFVRDNNIGAPRSTTQYTIGATTETVNCDIIVIQLAFMTMGVARMLT